MHRALFLVLLALTGCAESHPLRPSHIARADNKCAANEGVRLYWSDPVEGLRRVECNNGAAFRYPTKDTQ